MRAPALALLIPVFAAAACAKAPTPAEFLTKAIQGDNSKIRLGALAASKGGPAVAAFGRTLVTDHSDARAAAVAVAVHYGMTPPTDISDKAHDEQRKLERLSGNDFDKEFVAYMIADHRSDIDDFNKEVASNPPADVRKLATDTLPHLQQHLGMAQRMQ